MAEKEGFELIEVYSYPSFYVPKEFLAHLFCRKHLLFGIDKSLLVSLILGRNRPKNIAAKDNVPIIAAEKTEPDALSSGFVVDCYVAVL